MFGHKTYSRKCGDKKGRIRDILIIAALAAILFFAVWKIFYKSGTPAVSASVQGGSEDEKRLAALLNEIDGVGKTEVMIYQSEDGVKSVVVVCEGANNLRVIMDIREAVSAAVGAEEKYVKIYPMKE